VILGAYLSHSLFSIFQRSLIQARRAGLVNLVSEMALLTNIASNFAWIPKYGMTGAAYATLGGYAVELALIAIFAQPVLRLRFCAFLWLAEPVDRSSGRNFCHCVDPIRARNLASTDFCSSNNYSMICSSELRFS
jgi:Na+-driven multidrug efflux pump